MDDGPQRDLREALKTVAVALKETGLPFALIGGYGVWARGGPEPDHDVDFLVAAQDAPRIAQALADSGLLVVQPPEDWLFKIYVDDALVDVIYRPAGSWARREDLAAATSMEVLSVQMPVLPATDLLVHKLNALSEHACDFATLIPVARTLREQVDWHAVRGQTSGNPFAAALLFLLERIDVIGDPDAGTDTKRVPSELTAVDGPAETIA
jgi:hypothetical protein